MSNKEKLAKLQAAGYHIEESQYYIYFINPYINYENMRLMEASDFIYDRNYFVFVKERFDLGPLTNAEKILFL